MDLPDRLRYADSHEWIDPSPADGCPVGISDHAQAELSDVVYVELPEVGRTVEAGEAVAVVESVKAASDIYAPVAGTIVAANDALEAEPGTINTDPYRAGWIFKIRPSDPGSAFDRLHDAAAYRQRIG